MPPWLSIQIGWLLDEGIRLELQCRACRRDVVWSPDEAVDRLGLATTFVQARAHLCCRRCGGRYGPNGSINAASSIGDFYRNLSRATGWRSGLNSSQAHDDEEPAPVCNAYTVETNLAKIGEETERWLGLRLATVGGGPLEQSNLTWEAELYPARRGLFLRPRDGALEPVAGRWGLIPHYHQGGPKAFKLSTNNARAETMATAPTFKGAFARRRCIIPASAFVEWTGPKGSKTRHTITRAGGGMLFFAGLWGSYQDEEGEQDSYTLVMTAVAAADDMARFHTRQPVFLDQARAATWLDATVDPAPILNGLPASYAFEPPEPAPS